MARDRWNNETPMLSSRQPENIKTCPGCGTNLADTARQCAVCGYSFDAPEPNLPEDRPPALRRSTGWRTPDREPAPRPARRAVPGSLQVTLSLPVLVGIIALILVVNILVTLGLQKRDETKSEVFALQVTATYVATTYISPTPSPTPTGTPPPPTPTPIVLVEYTVQPGDSCISIADKFDLYVDSLLSKNDIDCALLSVGTVLIIPNPTPTPLPTGTKVPTPQ